MACKLFILFVCLTAVVHIHAVELGYNEHDHQHEDGHAEYEFHYSVHDPHTGDIKSQKESRKGHQVEGSYDLIDSDGHKRIVHYRADEHSGFVADVRREPTDIKIPIPEQHHQQKILAHAPLVHYSHASSSGPGPALQHNAYQPSHSGQQYAYQPSHLGQHYAHQPSHSGQHYDNHVSFSGPSHQYHY